MSDYITGYTTLVEKKGLMWRFLWMEEPHSNRCIGLSHMDFGEGSLLNVFLVLFQLCKYREWE